MLTGELEKTNEAYALAKISGLKLCEYYDKQYGIDYFSVMPCNLYGTGDNFNLDTPHVILALLRKFHEAKISGAYSITQCGTGRAMREFLHVNDMADACVALMEHYEGNDCVNIGCEEDVSISDLAEIIKKIVGYEGEIVYDDSHPDGTPRKLLDSSKLFSLA